MQCVTLETRQFFCIAAVAMALVLVWRNTGRPEGRDPWIDGVAGITLAVDGALWLVKSKECA